MIAAAAILVAMIIMGVLKTNLNILGRSATPATS
jgi:hypothetical protein